MIDVALALDVLVPAAEYGGCLTGNTKEEYEALRWEDPREKPSWESVQGVDTTTAESFEALARRVLDESASVPMLVQLAPILPSVLLFAQAGTVKGIQTALAILAGTPLPSELEDERTLLIQKLGG